MAEIIVSYKKISGGSIIVVCWIEGTCIHVVQYITLIMLHYRLVFAFKSDVIV